MALAELGPWAEEERILLSCGDPATEEGTANVEESGARLKALLRAPHKPAPGGASEDVVWFAGIGDADVLVLALELGSPTHRSDALIVGQANGVCSFPSETLPKRAWLRKSGRTAGREEDDDNANPDAERAALSCCEATLRTLPPCRGELGASLLPGIGDEVAVPNAWLSAVDVAGEPSECAWGCALVEAKAEEMPLSAGERNEPPSKADAMVRTEREECDEEVEIGDGPLDVGRVLEFVCSSDAGRVGAHETGRAGLVASCSWLERETGGEDVEIVPDGVGGALNDDMASSISKTARSSTAIRSVPRYESNCTGARDEKGKLEMVSTECFSAARMMTPFLTAASASSSPTMREAPGCIVSEASQGLVSPRPRKLGFCPDGELVATRLFSVDAPCSPCDP